MQRSPASVVPVVLIQAAVKQYLEYRCRAFSCSHAEDSPTLAVNAVSIAAPEQEDVDDVQVTYAGSGEQCRLSWLSDYQYCCV